MFWCFFLSLSLSSSFSSNPFIGVGLWPGCVLLYNQNKSVSSLVPNWRIATRKVMDNFSTSHRHNARCTCAPNNNLNFKLKCDAAFSVVTFVCGRYAGDVLDGLMATWKTAHKWFWYLLLCSCRRFGVSFRAT